MGPTRLRRNGYDDDDGPNQCKSYVGLIFLCSNRFIGTRRAKFCVSCFKVSCAFLFLSFYYRTIDTSEILITLDILSLLPLGTSLFLPLSIFLFLSMSLPSPPPPPPPPPSLIFPRPANLNLVFFLLFSPPFVLKLRLSSAIMYLKVHSDMTFICRLCVCYVFQYLAKTDWQKPYFLCCQNF